MGVSPPGTVRDPSHNIHSDVVRTNCSSLGSLGTKWWDTILPGLDNPLNWMYPDAMEMRRCRSTTGFPEYVHPVAQSTCVTHGSPYTHRLLFHLHYPSIFGHPPWLINAGLGSCDWLSSVMHLEAKIEWTQRSTWMPGWSQLGGILRVHDWVTLGID
jgi:hypothetical protein